MSDGTWSIPPSVRRKLAALVLAPRTALEDDFRQLAAVRLRESGGCSCSELPGSGYQRATSAKVIKKW